VSDDGPRAAGRDDGEGAMNKKTVALEKAFLQVDQIAEDLIRLIGEDPRYKAKAVSALTRIMTIKQELLEVVK